MNETTLSGVFLRFLETLAGAPSAGIGAAAFIYAIYRMARHQLLLYGSVSSGARRRYSYTFFLQNLEEFSFPWKIHVLIKDMRPQTERGVDLAVGVYAGPRDVVSRTDMQTRDGVMEGYWEATFERLSPFDTWKFVCETDSTWVKLVIDTDVRGSGARPRLVPDITPRTLALEATHPSRQRFKGRTVTPPIEVLVAIMFGVVLVYLSAVTYMQKYSEFVAVADFSWRWYDAPVVAGLVVSLWFGYRRIQRPVYPIMQGYLFQTHVRVHKPECQAPESGGWWRRAARVLQSLRDDDNTQK